MRTSTRDVLLARYGALMDAKALCELFRYPSVPALKRSIERGRFPVHVFSFPGRRGLFARTDVVAEVLDRAHEGEAGDDPLNNGHKAPIEGSP